MYLLFNFVLLCLFALSTSRVAWLQEHSQNLSDDKDYESHNKSSKLDVDTVLKALGAPSCMRKCIDPFIEKTTSLWRMNGIASNTRGVCTSHAEALSCLAKDKFCDTRQVFQKSSGNVGYMCSKHVLFEKMESCLAPIVDETVQECDATCFSRSNLTAFASNSNVKFAAQIGGNVFIVTDHLGDLCGSLACTLPCITKKLNAVCPYSGWLVLDVLLQPLDASATFFETMNPALRGIIEKKLDGRCAFAIDHLSINKIRNGDFSVLNAQ